MDRKTTHGKDGDVFCYGEMCLCNMPKKIWPFAVDGSDNIAHTWGHKTGRVVDGVFIALKPSNSA